MLPHRLHSGEYCNSDAPSLVRGSPKLGQRSPEMMKDHKRSNEGEDILSECLCKGGFAIDATSLLAWRLSKLG